MTPTTAMTSAPSINRTNKTHQAAPFVMNESPYAETPDQLTLDEMREMPMFMALGFETSIVD